MTKTITLNFSDYDHNDHMYSREVGSYPLSNAVSASTANTTYGGVYFSANSNSAVVSTYVYFLFDTSGIPNGSKIEGIDCKVKCSMNRIQNNGEPKFARAVLMNGNDALCNAVSFRSASANNVVTLSATGVDDVSSLRVKFEGNSRSNQYYMRIYGCTCTITYTPPPPFLPKVDGSFKTVEGLYVNIGGVWVKSYHAWVKTDGSWIEC
jgi:hypothetical protein